MLSRVAENLYWLARYIERAEGTARLISVNTHLLLDLPRRTAFGWEALIDITGGRDNYLQRFSKFDEVSVVSFLTGDLANPASILSSLTYARENLRTTRDTVPREAWEELNALYIFVRDNLANGVSPRGRDFFLRQIIRGSQVITGLLDGALSRTPARTFIMLGQALERADMTTRIVDVRSANLLPQANTEDLHPFENIQWMSVLKSLSGYQMYRQQERMRVRSQDVLRFLLQDPLFPRTVAYCLDRFALQLRRLSAADLPLAVSAAARQRVLAADVPELAAHPGALHQFIDDLQVDFGNIHTALATRYFVPPGEGTP